ncbi:hypothetical protein Ddye_029013 [Dipteronia dyeriana]|uniref:Uncharacterized protein n=1 Tax=Dipteronia dyeriana TaxID=168575 RepID=A0AAD9TEF8_9ROSI|nr:hypothetical protein Ddye_029013 [Dipteronia dyeriana]
MAAWPRMGTLILVKNEGVLLEFERGGQTLFMAAMKEFCKKHNPEIMVIAETRTSKENAMRQLPKLRLHDRCICIHPEGRAGGIWLCWTDKVPISEPLFISKQAIHVLVSEPNPDQWLLSGETIAQCNFLDLGFSGSNFTWTNIQFGGGYIAERLDRALANGDWIVKFSDATVNHLARTISDHNPLLISTAPDLGPRRLPFRTAQELRIWNHTVVGNLDLNIDKALTRLQALHVEIDNASMLNLAKLKEEAEVRKYFNECLLKKKLFGGRVDWLKERDRNTKFFHHQTLNRRSRNRLSQFRLDDGSTVYGQQNIQDETVAYFHNLYKSENPRLRAKLMGVISRLVTDEENERWISMLEESEIKKSSQCIIQKHGDLMDFQLPFSNPSGLLLELMW